MTDGTDVRIRGRLDWYAPRGQLQLRMTRSTPPTRWASSRWPAPSCCARLREEGLLRANADHPLPLAPAAGGAGHQRRLRRRGRLPRRAPAQRLRLPWCSGPTAVCRATTRPGRSRRPSACSPPTDPTCWPWCAGAAPAPTWRPSTTRPWRGPSPPVPSPVITGVGHEVDTSVADEVAHTAAKTPTACAAAARRPRRRGPGAAGGTVGGIAPRAAPTGDPSRRPPRWPRPPSGSRHPGGPRSQHPPGSTM